jgi:hypothetical protein
MMSFTWTLHNSPAASAIAKRAPHRLHVPRVSSAKFEGKSGRNKGVSSGFLPLLPDEPMYASPPDYSCAPAGYACPPPAPLAPPAHEPPHYRPASPSSSADETVVAPTEEAVPRQPSDEASSQPSSRRSRIAPEQQAVLSAAFEEDPLPSFEQRQELAERTGLTPRSVQIWFQNHRQRNRPAPAKTAPKLTTTTTTTTTMTTMTALGQAIGGGHCLTKLPPKRGGACRANGEEKWLPTVSLDSGSGKPVVDTAAVASRMYDLANALSPHSLPSPVAPAALVPPPPVPNMESALLARAMNQLRHNVAAATHAGATELPTMGMGSLAATQVLLSVHSLKAGAPAAGYHSAAPASPASPASLAAVSLAAASTAPIAPLAEVPGAYAGALAAHEMPVQGVVSAPKADTSDAAGLLMLLGVAEAKP